MARYDWAVWAPVKNHSGMGTVVHPLRGLVLHTEQGTEAGSEAWFNNPQSQASSHFGNPKNARLRQLVDTDEKAWAEAAGNISWCSLENEGNGEALTETQLDNAAHLLAWLHQTEGVPLQITDDPNGRGLGWHGMGGAAWGGHYDCPGETIKAQRADILHRAATLLGMTNPAPVTNKGAAMARFPKAVAAAATPDGTGVWVAGSDGGVFSCGTAKFHGSAGSLTLAAPIVDIAAHGAGGYWLLAADGGIFNYGDAPFNGSYPGLKPEQRQGDRSFLSIEAHGDHYTLLADDGGYYNF